MHHDETLIRGREDLRRVHQMLEEATGPSRTLDAYIHGVVENREVCHTPEGQTLATAREAPHDTCVYLRADGVAPSSRLGGEALTLPFYTRSLDAKMPDEEIVTVDLDMPYRTRWRATTADGHVGYGQTEATARRAAALEKMRTRHAEAA